MFREQNLGNWALRALTLLANTSKRHQLPHILRELFISHFMESLKSSATSGFKLVSLYCPERETHVSALLKGVQDGLARVRILRDKDEIEVPLECLSSTVQSTLKKSVQEMKEPDSLV